MVRVAAVLRGRLRLVAMIVVLVAGGLVVAAGDAAAAVSPNTDCNAHQNLTRQYTLAQLHHALDTMPGEMKEYTDCYDVIQRQLYAQLGHLRPVGSGAPADQSGGAFFPAPLLVVVIALVVGGGAHALGARRRGGDAIS